MDLSLLPLVFGLILTVSSRLLHPYHTDDKTFKLMEKIFPTVRDTQRSSESYMEKRRGRREIGISLGVGISKGITSIVGWATLISGQSIVIAAGFSAFIGILFGFWPAWKASNLDPIDALRTE